MKYRYHKSGRENIIKMKKNLNFTKIYFLCSKSINILEFIYIYFKFYRFFSFLVKEIYFHKKLDFKYLRLFLDILKRIF